MSRYNRILGRSSNYCFTSLVIRDDKGICNKCNYIRFLTDDEKINHHTNITNSIVCKCGGRAYTHDNKNIYECMCCFSNIVKN
jgi:hypothetical protein